MSDSRYDVIVLGAGMVGSASAAQLALRGVRVALVDRRGPGEETSYGNSGFMDAAAFMPHVMPRDLKTLIARATGRTPHVNVHVSMLPQLLGWFRRYWRESTPERVIAAATRLAPLAAHSVTEHHALAEKAGSRHLIRDTGVLRGYRLQATFDAAASDRDLLRRHGIEMRELDPAQLAELEPCLLPGLARALWHPKACHAVDPGALTKSYAALAQASGGRVVTGDAGTLARTANGWSVTTEHGPIRAPQVVVALGPWAKELLARFGVSVPIAIKRGYHLHYSLSGNSALSRPISESEVGYVLSPMAKGVRLTTGAEFADRDAAPTPLQLAACEPHARRLAPLDRPVEPTPWMGARPCSPDSAPIIDAMPGNPGMWFAGAHGHWGFGLGAVTGRLVAELVTAATPVVDPVPLGLGRFR